MSILDRLRDLLQKKQFYKWGIFGSIITLIALFVPQIGYKDPFGKSFSILTHLVSELSMINVSPLSWMFNVGLIIAGLSFIPFMLGLGPYFQGILSKLGTILGVIACIACSLTGIFPMDVFLIPHYAAALGFFLCAALTTAIFTIALLIQDTEIPKSFVIPGLIVIGAYITLVSLDLSPILKSFELGLMWIYINRPQVWMVAIMEWAVVLSIVGYFILFSIYFYVKNRD